MPVNKFGESTSTQPTHKVASIVTGITSAEVNNNYLRLDGNNLPKSSINMNTHQIINSKDTLSTDANNVVATKGYVDSSIAASHTTASTTNNSTCLLKTGDTMSGTLDMGNNKINNVQAPTSTTDLNCVITAGYANDHYVHKKINPTQTSSTFSNILDASINFNGNRAFNLATPLLDNEAATLGYVKSSNYNDLSETRLWEYYTRYGTAIYRIDRGNSSEVIFDSTTRKVSKIYDQTLKENGAEQTTVANQPTLCTKANKLNHRYFLNFSGTERMISDIDLNPETGVQDIINIFIIYKLTDFTGTYWLRNGLFGHDNGGYDKFVAFGPGGELVVSGAPGTTSGHAVFGPSTFNNVTSSGTYQTNANPSETNKWISLSVHWNIPGGANKSSVWCNGKKLGNFTAATKNGSNQMTFGDLNPTGIAGLKGSIALFALYKGKLIDDLDIKVHHHVFCNYWYNITHDPITF